MEGQQSGVRLGVKAAKALPRDISEALGKLPPQAIELEQAVLGALMLEKDALTISYPVNEFPQKIKSHNFDKEPNVEGILKGIKGQYLILDSGVINIRKFTSYEIQFYDELN